MTNHQNQEPSQAISALKNFDNWINYYKFANDPIVHKLRSDLEKNVNLSFWAEKNLDTVLPQKKISPNSNLRLGKTLANLRNLLVFIPVALTWLAVSKATSGFAKFIDDNNGTTANFLQFWQNGYGYLDDSWKIGHIAFLDFLIIVGVILVSIASTSLTNIGRKSMNEETLKFDFEKRLVVLELEIYLSKFKLSATSENIEKLPDLTGKLNSGIQSLTNLSELVQKISTNFSNISEALQSQSRQLIDALNKNAQVSETELVKVLSTIQRIGNELQNNLLKNYENISNSSNSISSDLNEISSNISNIKNKLKKLLGLSK